MTTFVWIWMVAGVLVLPMTLWYTAPFGRHTSRNFGPLMNNRLGWWLMESPTWWLFPICFLSQASHNATAAWVLFGLWLIHYINRGWVFPYRIRTIGKQIPVLVVGCGFVFQLVNGYLNGTALTQCHEQYTAVRLGEPLFWGGGLIFIIGWGINVWSDEVLLKLRRPGETGYRVPQNGLFRWISCPNFLGEIIQWCGWALMCWNLAALSFAVWTVANLVPRALAHHRWYQRQFADYPTDRTALIPGLL